MSQCKMNAMNSSIMLSLIVLCLTVCSSYETKLVKKEKSRIDPETISELIYFKHGMHMNKEKIPPSLTGCIKCHIPFTTFLRIRGMCNFIAGIIKLKEFINGSDLNHRSKFYLQRSREKTNDLYR